MTPLRGGARRSFASSAPLALLALLAPLLGPGGPVSAERGPPLLPLSATPGGHHAVAYTDSRMVLDEAALLGHGEASLMARAVAGWPRSGGGGRPGRLVLFVPPAAQIPFIEPPPTEPEPPPTLLTIEGTEKTPMFQGHRDDDLLGAICQQPLRSIRPLGGGASISLRAVFADGSLAAVKPEQKRVTRFQSEVAAYRVSRALGLSRVSPSCVRRFPVAQIYDVMSPSMRARMDEELLIRRGEVAAAVIHWIPELHGLRLEKRTWWQPLLRRGAKVATGDRERLKEISTLLLFDYLIVNDDRWSGGNTHESEGRMVFLDQGASFGRDDYGAGHGRRRKLFSQLRRCERFDREVVAALRALDVPGLQVELGKLLTPAEVDDFGERVAEARAYLSRLEHEAPEDWLL